jgi:ribosome-associated protein
MSLCRLAQRKLPIFCATHPFRWKISILPRLSTAGAQLCAEEVGIVDPNCLKNGQSKKQPSDQQDGALVHSALTGLSNKVVNMNEQFELRNEYIALCDLLKVVGVVDSGGAGKQLVAAGEVQVDGAVELRKTCKIRPGQTVSGNGFTIKVVASHG